MKRYDYSTVLIAPTMVAAWCWEPLSLGPLTKGSRKITRILALTFFFSALSYTRVDAVVTFDWAIVGNPGNADDTRYDNPGYGGVDYTYRISKHEVTNAQYTEFLNAVDPTGANTLSLYAANMANFRGGIENTGTVDGAQYIAKAGREQNPVNFLTFFDAMRFVNWLHNGQGSGDTESGVYAIGNGINEVRSANANFWIPNADEWYKAAYYDPNSGVYYDYPTGTDTEPYSDNPASLNTPDDTNVANFRKDDAIANGYDDGYAVTGSNSIVNNQNYLTDVGAYSLATSPYGTFDQGGNVLEWNEAVMSGIRRGLRGGAWHDTSYSLRTFPEGDNPYNGDGAHSYGFRVASIAEPRVPGDYNEDGVVNAADYTVWRDHYGTDFDLPNRNPGAMGDINQADYDFWVANFGMSGASAASLAVASTPESPAVTLACLGIMSLPASRRRKFNAHRTT